MIVYILYSHHAHQKQGNQRKGEKIKGRGSAKAIEVVEKIRFEDTKSSMEQRLAKIKFRYS
jgi:hypothetical protein